MGDSACFVPVRGSVLRVTKLDACGAPLVTGPIVAVTKRVSSVALEEVSDAGTSVVERNTEGEIVYVAGATVDVVGYSASIELMGVDTAVVEALTGQPIVRNAAGDVAGFDATTSVQIDAFGFSVEVWSRLAGAPCDPLGQRLWGYTLFPFFKGGRLGGFSFANGAVNLTITGAQTRGGSKWGVGPYDVDRNASGIPSRLHTPVSPDTHYRSVVVALDPPQASCAGLVVPPPGPGGSGLILIDNGDGTYAAIGTPVVDNLDGTFTATDPAFTDTGGGTFSAVA